MAENQNLPGGALRRLAAAKAWVSELYIEHIYRYYSTDQEEGRQLKYRGLTWLAAGTAAVLVLTAGYWLAHPVYRHFEEKHDQKLAQMFLARGDYQNAWLSAFKTTELNPTNVPACRVLAELADRKQSPEALDWLWRIAETEPTAENKLNLAKAGLRYQGPPYPITTRVVEELAPTAGHSASFQALAASLALATHQLPAAEAGFAMAASLDPTNQLYVLNLAMVRLGLDDQAKAALGRLELEKLSWDGKFGRAALSALILDDLAAGKVLAAAERSTQLLASPQATLADHLQNLEILQRLKSPDWESRLQAVLAKAATNALAVAQVSGWMQRQGLMAENLAWLTGLPARIRIQTPVQLALVEGDLAGGHWNEMLDIARHGSWDDLEYLRLALVSRAWSQLGQPGLAAHKWEEAVNQAGLRLGSLSRLLSLAETWRREREREQVLEQLVQTFPQENWARRALEQVYFINGNTAAMNQLCARLASRFPLEVRFQNNLTGTDLLLKTNLPQACQRAAEAYRQSPDNPHAATTYAFALYLQGRTQTGLELLQKFAPTELAQPSVALYFGILLAAAGKSTEAAPYLEIANRQGRLWPEEKQLLTAAQAGLKVRH